MVYHNCKNEHVLLISRTKKYVRIIKRCKAVRKVVKLTVKVFDDEYVAVAVDPKHIAELWLNSPFSPSKEAREILEAL